jgi:hypothetical protein
LTLGCRKQGGGHHGGSKGLGGLLVGLVTACGLSRGRLRSLLLLGCHGCVDHDRRQLSISISLSLSRFVHGQRRGGRGREQRGLLLSQPPLGLLRRMGRTPPLGM